jgi:hypothetical protein
MASRHACFLCDFSREAEHSTVLEPDCPSCGTPLRHVGNEPEPTVDRLSVLTRTRWFERTLLTVIVLPLLLAAAKIGWSAAGAATAAAAMVFAVLAVYVALAPATRHR